MGRHAAMKPAVDLPQDSCALPVRSARCEDEESTLTSEDAPGWAAIDERHLERATMLAARRRQLHPSPHRSAAIDVAIGIWVHTPLQTAATDRDAVTTLAWVLLTDADSRGHIDPEAALEPRSVERFLARNVRGWSTTSMPTYRWYLTAAGRVVRPGDYPPLRLRVVEDIRNLRAGGPCKASPWRVASRAEVDNAYALASRDAAFARRTVLILDLVTGAGLRASELRRLQFSDIVELCLPRGVVLAAVTTSAKNFAVQRTIPIVDEGKAHRLLDFCRGKPDNHLVIAPDGMRMERNAVNRPAERLRDRGYPGFDVEALRNWWILEMACRVPTAILASLADISREDLHRMVLASDIEDDLAAIAAYLRAVSA